MFDSSRTVIGLGFSPPDDVASRILIASRSRGAS